MPITPLHLGLLAPLNHFAPKRVSNVSFILTTLWIDGNAILYYAFNLPYEEFHGPWTHSLLGACGTATVVALCGILSKRWILGAYLGGVSHVLLDMLVHPELEPLFPWTGNPFYFGLMEPLSLIMMPFLVWLTAQYVSGIRGWFGARLGVRPQRSSNSDA